VDEAGQQALSEVDFASFKRKVQAAYGVNLDAYKRPQMERRLRANMDRCGALTFIQYYAIMRKDSVVLDEFLDRLTINVSELFRNPEQFEVLRKEIMPRLLARRGGLSVWSAGCSYGAEAYTLAILLDELAPVGRHSVLASDIDDRMLARAAGGVFQEAEVANVSKPRLLKYFDRGPDGYTARPVLRQMVSFAKLDLLRDPFRTGFDLIACRNVVIYFTDEAKSQLYRRFCQSLRPGGCLFVGSTERISDCAEVGFENNYSFFYKKPEIM